jgi:hypothetical protein
MAPTSPADHRYTLPAEAGYVGQVGALNGIATLYGQQPAGGFAIALASSGASPYQSFSPYRFGRLRNQHNFAGC